MRASPSCPPRAAMASSSARPAVLAVTALALSLLLCLGPGKWGDAREPGKDISGRQVTDKVQGVIELLGFALAGLGS